MKEKVTVTELRKGKSHRQLVTGFKHLIKPISKLHDVKKLKKGGE
jgi:hypothetical protein